MRSINLLIFAISIIASLLTAGNSVSAASFADKSFGAAFLVPVSTNKNSIRTGEAHHPRDPFVEGVLELRLPGLDKGFRPFVRAGLDPLRSLDPSQEVSAAYSPNGMWRGESQIEALQNYRAAREAIPEDFREPLAAIVLNDREIVDVGREIGAYKDAKMAGAVALFILRRSLRALARHYRMISTTGTARTFRLTSLRAAATTPARSPSRA
jgi:hypothetical protein